MRIIDKLLKNCNYNSNNTLKKYDTGGAFANASMDNEENLEYIMSNREAAIGRVGTTEPYKEKARFLEKNDAGKIVSRMFLGSMPTEVPVITYKSIYGDNTDYGDDTPSGRGYAAPPKDYKVDERPITKDRLQNAAQAALIRNGRTDVTAEQLAELAEAQKDLEGYYPGSKAYNTNNPFNVGNTDNNSVKYYQDTDEGINSYYDLILKRYLPKGKSIESLYDNFENVDGNRYATNPKYEEALKIRRNKKKTDKKQTGGTVIKDNAQSYLERLLVRNREKGIGDDVTYSAWKESFLPQIGVESGTSPEDNFQPKDWVFNSENKSDNASNNNPVNIRDITKKKDPKTKVYPFKKFKDPTNVAGMDAYTDLITSDKYLKGDLSAENRKRLLESGYRRQDYGDKVDAYYDNDPKNYVIKVKDVAKSVNKKMSMPEIPITAAKPYWIKVREEFETTNPFNKYADTYYKANNILSPAMTDKVVNTVKSKYEAEKRKYVLDRVKAADPIKKGESLNAYKRRLMSRVSEDKKPITVGYLQSAIYNNPDAF